MLRIFLIIFSRVLLLQLGVRMNAANNMHIKDDFQSIAMFRGTPCIIYMYKQV